MAIDPSSPVAPRPLRAEEPAADSETPSVWGEDGFTFGDVLDMVNPLQHLPIVSMLYRGITGDEIAQGPRIIGGLLFGGPSGAVFAAIDSSIEAETGLSFGGHMANAITGGALAPIGAEAVNPDPAAPGAAAANAAALSDAEFWAMRMSPTDPDFPEGMVVGPVLTPPPTAHNDLDFAQISARTTVAPFATAAVETLEAPAGYLSGGAAHAQTSAPQAVSPPPPPPPAPRIGAAASPSPTLFEEDPEAVFAEMMRGLDRYDALRTEDAAEDS